MTDTHSSPAAAKAALSPALAGQAPETAPLVAVDRACAELRRGGLVVLTSPQGAYLIGAAEAADPALLTRLNTLAGAEADLIITARRASVMGLDPAGAQALRVSLPDPVEDTLVAVLSDPAAAANTQQAPPTLPSACKTEPAPDGHPAEAAVLLTKLARLLPSAVMAPLDISEDASSWAEPHRIVVVREDDIRGYHHIAAQTLRPVGDARVPLEGAENTRILAFRPADGGIEHLAIVIGTPDPDQPVLARLHSECFTGDLLGSLRCDCGDQLRGAILSIADAGAGVLLYLAQEGRGIGLVNKLRAYQLQDAGFDTLDANGQLGFDDDERIYQPAAEMLRQLGFGAVRLMTNNPLKVEALARHGIEVTERVPHVFQSNVHNLSYLRTKAIKGGHLF